MPAKQLAKKVSGLARKSVKDKQTPSVVSVHGLMWYNLDLGQDRQKKQDQSMM
jgi:hypothetical protein